MQSESPMVNNLPDQPLPQSPCSNSSKEQQVTHPFTQNTSTRKSPKQVKTPNRQTKNTRKYNNIVGYLTSNSLFKKDQHKQSQNLKILPKIDDKLEQGEKQKAENSSSPVGDMQQGNEPLYCLASISEHIKQAHNSENETKKSAEFLDTIKSGDRKALADGTGMSKQVQQAEKSVEYPNEHDCDSVQEMEPQQQQRQQQVYRKQQEKYEQLLSNYASIRGSKSSKFYQGRDREAQHFDLIQMSSNQPMPIPSPSSSFKSHRQRQYKMQHIPVRFVTLEQKQNRLIQQQEYFRSNANRVSKSNRRSPQHLKNTLSTSRKRYFDQCRFEAREYLLDIQTQLLNSHYLIQQFKQNLHIEMLDLIQQKKTLVKRELQRVLQSFLQDWDQTQQAALKNRELDYLDDVLELELQITQRLGRIEASIEQLQRDSKGQQRAQLTHLASGGNAEEKEYGQAIGWRQITADLLVSDQDHSVVEITQRCRRLPNSLKNKIHRGQCILNQADGISLNDGQTDQILTEGQINQLKEQIFSIIKSRSSLANLSYKQLHKKYGQSDPDFVARFAKITKE